MSDFDYASLDDGIRATVQGLREAGFNTTDSGDGSKAGFMEGAMDRPMVAVLAQSRATICDDADALLGWLSEHEPERLWDVSATYAPRDGVAVIVAFAFGREER